MKTNEALEKIYLIRNFPNSTSLNTTNDHHGKFLDGWYMSREKDADVEYTRTDAFIDKAANYLNYILYDRVEIKKPETIISSLCVKGEFIEDFRNYMKGE